MYVLFFFFSYFEVLHLGGFLLSCVRHIVCMLESVGYPNDKTREQIFSTFFFFFFAKIKIVCDLYCDLCGLKVTTIVSIVAQILHKEDLLL